MLRLIKRFTITSILFVCATSMAQTEIYHLLVPSRDGKKENIVQIGENNGTKLLAMASCKQCMPAVYTHNKQASEVLGKPVYGTSGIYVIPYDENSYMSVAPKSPLVPLGEGIWKTFYYANFFSKDKNKVATMTTAKVEEWAIQLSEKIMTGDSSQEIDANSVVYYPAVKIGFSGGKKETKVEITYNKQQLTIASTTNGGKDIYEYKPDFSDILGIDVYGDNRNLREYVFVESPTSIIWAKFNSGRDLGKSAWGEHEVYNYFHKDQQIVRKLLVNKQEQDALDKKMSVWASKAKEFKETEYANKEASDIKNRRLPSKGLQNKELEIQALVAAKNWANKYRWKETVTHAYFTGNDWSIYRNKLTGIQLGRRIGGVIVMKRLDGKCSFHHATFAQQFNGSSYQKVFTEGIVPGQNILECKNVQL